MLLGGLGALAATPAWSQTPAETESAEARLLNNLFTRMAARVGVNQRRRFVFVIDTGAGRTAVSDRTAAELDLPPGPPVLVHGVTSAVLTPTVRLGSLDFGGLRFDDLLAPVFGAEQLGAEGLVGLDVLSRFRLTFDQGRRTMFLAPSGGNTVEASPTFYEATRMKREGRSEAVEHRGQLVLTQAWAEGHAIDIFVDSGAQFSIGNPALGDLTARFSPAAPRERVTVYGVTGQSIVAETGQVGDLRIGSSRLGTTPLLFADLHAFRHLGLTERPALLVGADLLTRFRNVRIDFGRGRLNFSGLRRARPEDGIGRS